MSDVEREVHHVPVLLDQTVEALRASQGGMFLDCTFGGGGHSRALLEASPDACVVGLDRDGRAIERGRRWGGRYGERLTLIHAPFSNVESVVSFRGFDGILADLGMSTDQLREGRGFSFADTQTLDMRMDEGSGETAAEFVNGASEHEIFVALAEGGVGANARGIARAIVNERPFESAQQLAEVVRFSHLGKRSESKVHPATVVFQALRMKVNREREEIETLLDAAPRLVKQGGRLAVITFHSVEDKLVTSRMRSWESAGSYPASWRGPRTEKKIGRVVYRKPIVPADDEIASNPASRSARLRVFEFEEIF
jgi:16S rRNA (cytosine1402-N4)-methyltransferase